jgi:3-oxoadipate enol-lactonase
MTEKKQLFTSQRPFQYYTTGRKDNPAIIFLHAAFIDHKAFKYQNEFFSESFHVITIDMPGHGLSKPGIKIDETIHYLNSILVTEKHEQAHFVGVSMGSLIAQYFALHYPDKVLSMTVVGGYDINADNRELLKAQRSENLKWIFKAIFSMNAFRRHVASVSVSKPDQQDRIYEMTQNFTRRSFMGMSGLNKVVKQRKNITRNYPLLILCGENDIDIARKVSKQWHKQSSSEFFLISNAGHCANMDNPREFNRRVMAFIQGQGESRSEVEKPEETLH